MPGSKCMGGRSEHEMWAFNNIASHQRRSTCTSHLEWWWQCLSPLKNFVAWDNVGRYEVPAVRMKVMCCNVPCNFIISAHSGFQYPFLPPDMTSEIPRNQVPPSNSVIVNQPWILFIVKSCLLFSSDPATMCSPFMYISPWLCFCLHLVYPQPCTHYTSIFPD